MKKIYLILLVSLALIGCTGTSADTKDPVYVPTKLATVVDYTSGYFNYDGPAKVNLVNRFKNTNKMDWNLALENDQPLVMVFKDDGSHVRGLIGAYQTDAIIAQFYLEAIGEYTFKQIAKPADVIFDEGLHSIEEQEAYTLSDHNFYFILKDGKLVILPADTSVTLQEMDSYDMSDAIVLTAFE